MTNTEATKTTVALIAARYNARVAAAVEWARTDEFMVRYMGLNYSIATSIALSDKFGTWVAHDAMKIIKAEA